MLSFEKLVSCFVLVQKIVVEMSLRSIILSVKFAFVRDP